MRSAPHRRGRSRRDRDRRREGNTNDVQLTRPANGVPLFLAAGDGVAIGPGDIFLLTNRKGIAVTAGTGDLIHVANGGAERRHLRHRHHRAHGRGVMPADAQPRWITVRKPFDYPWPGRQAVTPYSEG
jgi:hypothetical protein